MVKKSNSAIGRNTVKAALTKETAQITGLSERSVRRVLCGDQVNEEVMSTYMELWERYPQMVDAVKQLVPLTNKKIA